MPCSDGGYGAEDYRRHANALTDLLCEACNVLVKHDHMEETSLHLRHWWIEHRKKDAERRAYEQQKIDEENKRQEALKKLTEHEMQLLGVSRYYKR